MPYCHYMSLRILRTAVDGLPQALQRRVLDYGAYINEIAPEIFEEAAVTLPTQREVDELVFIAGMRKLWSLVEFQNNTINAITSAAAYGFAGITARGTVLTRGSNEVIAVNAMEAELRSLFEASDLMPLIRLRSLRAVARHIRS